MRGKDIIKPGGCQPLGITPAYAGKRVLHPDCAFNRRDHPRVCGEKAIKHLFKPQRQGSPPRMRGKATDTVQALLTAGITPAYAGKSFFLIYRHSVCQDHPRVCGEKTLPALWGDHTRGSPPRMRGKVFPVKFQVRYKRITPAYAGKRTQQRWPCIASWDHPRVCGEKNCG